MAPHDPLKLLIIGPVWPEPTASAAGWRVLNLTQAFLARGVAVTFSADAREGEPARVLRGMGVSCARLAPNDPAFDGFLADLAPDVVLFDRYTTEEKFSWRVRAAFPRALRVLDTIDLHFLRAGREGALKAAGPSDWDTVLAAAGDTAAREVAAIYRSDLSLLTSDVEEQLLIGRCGVRAELLQLCRMQYPKARAGAAFSAREGFISVGSFRHAPNVDAVLWLKEVLWPMIRRALPSATVDVFGAHATAHHMALSDPGAGFHLRGFAEDLPGEMGRRRVNLAPLRFGAGIKGKIADGWTAGTPAVTTGIGAEGMHAGLPFGGLVAEGAESFAAAAVRLHEDETLWRAAAADGARIIDTLYDPSVTVDPTVERILALAADPEAARRRNFTGRILWQQGLRSTEYFSRWIEAKNKKMGSGTPCNPLIR